MLWLRWLAVGPSEDASSMQRPLHCQFGDPVLSRAEPANPQENHRVIDGEFGNVGGVVTSTQKDGFMDVK